jgi:hypothetical protein
MSLKKTVLLNHCKDLYRLRHMGTSRKIFPVPSHQKSLRDDQGQMIHAISGTAERGEVRQQTPGQIPRGETQGITTLGRRSLTNQFLPSTKSGTSGTWDMLAGFKWCLSLWLKSDTTNWRDHSATIQPPTGAIGPSSHFGNNISWSSLLHKPSPPCSGNWTIIYIYICNEAWR